MTPFSIHNYWISTSLSSQLILYHLKNVFFSQLIYRCRRKLGDSLFSETTPHWLTVGHFNTTMTADGLSSVQVTIQNYLHGNGSSEIRSVINRGNSEDEVPILEYSAWTHPKNYYLTICQRCKNQFELHLKICFKKIRLKQNMCIGWNKSLINLFKSFFLQVAHEN